MTWVALKTWVYREVPGFAGLNVQLRDNLDHLYNTSLQDHDPSYAVAYKDGNQSISTSATWSKVTPWNAAKDDDGLWSETNNRYDIAAGVWWTKLRLSWAQGPAGAAGYLQASIYIDGSILLLATSRDTTVGGWGSFSDQVELERLIVDSSTSYLEAYCRQQAYTTLNVQGTTTASSQQYTAWWLYKLSGSTGILD